MIDFCEVLEYNGKEASPIARARAQTHRQGYAVTVICARGTPLTP